MSKHHDLTASYGESLVTCEHQFEASYYYHQVREQCMNHIHEISKAVAEFTVDFTDESLKILELLYYDLEDGDRFDCFSITKEEFEECMKGIESLEKDFPETTLKHTCAAKGSATEVSKQLF